MGSCVLAVPQIWTLEEVPGEEHPGRGYSGRVRGGRVRGVWEGEGL